ncbi:hypothetical protein MKX03_005112, partial [Papaver bracteatum]
DKKNSSPTRTSIQKQMVPTGINKRKLISSQPESVPVPDVADWFFGNVTNREVSNNKCHNPNTPTIVTTRIFEEDIDDEAKRLVSASPSRTCDSPTRLVGSPRFASASGGSRDFLDRRYPLSRFARRYNYQNQQQTIELSKPTAEGSLASAVHQWFSNIFNPHHNQQRYLSRRTFKSNNSVPGSPKVLSPPRNLIESVHRRTNSSSTCALPEIQLLLSPPRNLLESTHRRSISSSTCSLDKFSLRPDSNIKEVVERHGFRDLNGFLEEQRSNIARISNGDSGDAQAKFVFSGSSNSTSSMVATICYAWLLANTSKCNADEGDATSQVVVVPVMNMKRKYMWKKKQVAWLVHHVGIDDTSLLFSDEVDVETLTMRKQLSIVVIGQDVLRANGEVGSQCTILTDNYCEDAYDLVQVPVLNRLNHRFTLLKIILAILSLLVQLNAKEFNCTNRDAEAVQLLLVGSSTNYRNALFDLLMQEQRDTAFLEALRQNYGKSPSRSDHENGEITDKRVSAKTTISQISNKNENDARNVNKTVRVSPKLAKWFGLGPKS